MSMTIKSGNAADFSQGSIALKESFLALRERFIWIAKCWATYRAFYESGSKTDDVMRRSAPWFFHDFNLIIIDYLILEICKVTDRSVTMGRENLTVENLWDQLNAVGMIQNGASEIRSSYECVKNYKDFIKDARNRLVAHFDKETVLKGEGLGGHDADEVYVFFDNLEIFSDCVGRLVGAGPQSFKWGSPGPGDALDLLKVLKRGLANNEKFEVEGAEVRS